MGSEECDLRDHKTGLLTPGPDRENRLLEFSSGSFECPSCSKFLCLQEYSTCHGEQNSPNKYLQMSTVGCDKPLKYFIKYLYVQYFHGGVFQFFVFFLILQYREHNHVSFLRNPWFRPNLWRQHQRAVQVTVCPATASQRDHRGYPILPRNQGGQRASPSLETNQVPAWVTPSFSYKTEGWVRAKLENP